VLAAVTIVMRNSTPAAEAASRPAAASIPREPDATRWLQVLERLDWWRARAWRTGRAALLAHVYTPSSPSLAVDRAMLAAYRGRGLHASGVRLGFLSVRVVRQRPGAVVVSAVDRLSPVRVRTAAGTAVGLPTDRPTAHVVALRRVGRGWRIDTVRALSSDQSGPDSSAASSWSPMVR
jgi:eukaryotic-like serine/threonine-protein kinase